MDQKELSKLYFDATVRMRQYVTAFYDEYMHTDKGDPISNLDRINQAILELRQAMNIELDLIREASKEFKQK